MNEPEYWNEMAGWDEWKKWAIPLYGKDYYKYTPKN